jgi:endonuclease/exonuclease/phosphatase (EEP) superfamily protein YafD
MSEQPSVLRRVALSLQNIAKLLVFLYTALLIILSVAWLVAPQATWWLSMSYVLAPNFFILAPFVFLFTLFNRSKPFIIASGLIIVLYLAQFGSYLVPPSQQNVRSQSSLEVVSFNQLFTNRTGEETLAYIKSLDVDFIAIQEMSRGLAKGIEEDQEIQQRYPYQILRPADSAAGQAILSRIPFTDMGMKNPDLRLQAVQFMHGDEVVTLLNVHFSAPQLIMTQVHDYPTPLGKIPLIKDLPLLNNYDTSNRNRSMEALIELVDQLEGNLLVVGDLNTPDRDPIYAPLAERMTDVYAATNWGYGFTYPNRSFWNALHFNMPLPLVRLDYVWIRGGFLHALSSRVDCSPLSSDHCAVIAEIGLGVD